jgi:cytochrome c oxidase cbb3-type subunit 1
MTQWWYGHNAVGFFLTAGFLGIMYYFIPKRVERPVYSYRLSIVHFWSLIFLYIWAGPHHLHYTALPDWAQTLGMTISIMLWMPSWGGMINGLMTLVGRLGQAAHGSSRPHARRLGCLLRHVDLRRPADVDQGGQLAVALHRLDDRPRPLGRARLGRHGFTFGAIYCLVPWLWKRKGLYSMSLVEWHFWLATIGIVLYITSMWVSGITQGLMWRAYDNLGFLKYSFIETVEAMHWPYIIRAFRRRLFLLGALIMAYNVWRTIRGDEPVDIADQPASPPRLNCARRHCCTS